MQNIIFLKEMDMKLEMGKYLLILIKLFLVLKKCLRRLLEYKQILILKKDEMNLIAEKLKSFYQSNGKLENELIDQLLEGKI